MNGDEQKVSLIIENNVRGKKKLEQYAETLQKVNNEISKMPKSFTINGNNVGDLSSKLDKVVSSIQSIKNGMNKVGENTQKAFSVGKMAISLRLLGKMSSITGALTEKSSAYVENINLYQVAFNGAYKGADRFINKVSEMYGLDESKLIQSVGIFKQLTNAMNISADTGERLSTLLAQMSIDISSLYNVDIERASSVLQSALSGQTRPIRSVTGADVTIGTLQQELEKLNINRYINDLSYAEKRLLIIISLTNQLSEATNDFGRTIESPANQMRILSEQWDRMIRAMGNVFFPLVGKILPYLNAILMVITEILNVIGSIFGFTIDNFDYFGSEDKNLDRINNSINNMGAGLDKADKAAKKLKSGLRGFDKLNVITSPKSGGAGGGGGISGGGISGIDPKIQEEFNKAFERYNKRLTDVKMKATEIRDNIMDWLGFTKKLDPITGKVSFKYEGIKKTLSNMWKSFKMLSPEAKALSVILAFIVGKKILGGFTALLKLTGASGLYRNFKYLISPIGGLLEILSQFKNPIRDIGLGLNSWSRGLSVVDKLKISLMGAAGLVVGLKLAEAAMNNIAETGKISAKSMLELSGSFVTMAGSGALIGSQFGATGAVIGGTIGAIASLVKMYMDFPTQISVATEKINKEVAAIRDYNNQIIAQTEAIKKSAVEEISLQGAYQSFVTELEKIVDVNGKVKEGYENRAKFIVTTLNNAYGTEIKMVGNVIKEYNKQIDKIKEVIKQKKLAIYQETADKLYEEAIKKETELWAKREEASKQAKKAEENLKKAQEEFIKLREKLSKGPVIKYGVYLAKIKKLSDQLNKAKEASDNANKAFKDIDKTWNEGQKTISNYGKLNEAILSGNQKLIDEYINEISNSYKKGDETITLSMEKRKEKALDIYAATLEAAKDNGKKINETTLATANRELSAMNTTLSKLTETTKGDLSNKLIAAWGTLANSSEKEFMKEFSQLNSDLQVKIIDGMKDKGYKISKNLQEGINKLKPTVKIDANTSSLSQKLKNVFKPYISGKFGKIFEFGKSVGKVMFQADGGMPPVGQLFVANEKGPELVGHLGGKSFVANQKQMMNLLDKKMGNTQNNSNQVYNIYLDKSHKIASYTLSELQDMARQNGEPINIGG